MITVPDSYRERTTAQKIQVTHPRLPGFLEGQHATTLTKLGTSKTVQNPVQFLPFLPRNTWAILTQLLFRAHPDVNPAPQ